MICFVSIRKKCFFAIPFIPSHLRVGVYVYPSGISGSCTYTKAKYEKAVENIITHNVKRDFEIVEITNIQCKSKSSLKNKHLCVTNYSVSKTGSSLLPTVVTPPETVYFIKSEEITSSGST